MHTSTSTGQSGGTLTVPNVVGFTIDDAGVTLTGVGLKIKVTSPATRKKGTTYSITSQTPKAGTSTTSGATVRVAAKAVGTTTKK
jgi:beta-lactam-binding protein with PASTA domain